MSDYPLGYTEDEPTGYDPNPPRDTESYVGEAKYYYDNALILIDNNSYAFHDIDKQAVALDRAKDYIGWLLAYNEELKEKYYSLISDIDGSTL